MEGIAPHTIWLGVFYSGDVFFHCTAFQQASKHDIFEQKTVTLKIHPKKVHFSTSVTIVICNMQ